MSATPLLPLRLLSLFVLLALPVSLARADELEDRRAADEATYTAALTEAAAQADQQGDTAEAAALRGWIVRRDPGRQVAFVPGTAGEGPQSISELRAQRAEQLVALAVEYSAVQREAEAFSLLCQALREDPNHAEARRVLGFRGEPGAWHLTPADGTATQPRQGERRLGWAAGSYWEAETDHFQVVTNAGAAQAEALGQTLEDLYWVWNQLFFDYTGGAARLRGALAGRRVRPQAIRKMRVVMFATPEEYREHLVRWAPQIGISRGMYREADRTCYLYDDPATRSTWYHEGTHQLFYESGSTRPNVAAEHNMWLVEGVAIYMESLTPYTGYYAVGGFDADRLQVARYRAMNERSYVPLAELVMIGSDALKRRDDVSRIYTQSAGITHYLLDGENGALRAATIDLLKDIYAGRDAVDSLASLTDRSFEQLDAGYRAYLNVTDGDLAYLKPPQYVERLCLGHTEVTAAGLANLAGYNQLAQLDLAYCPVESAVAETLLTCPALAQLNLEGTQVTDEALAEIGRLRGLQVLDLSQTAVTDAGVAELADLANLQVLWLTGTQVTDAGLAHLQGLERLKYLNCNNTGVTTAGMEGLKEHLPRLGQGE